MSNVDFKLTSEEVQRERGGPVTVFSLRGWLDAQSEAQLFSAAQEAHTKGARYLVLNLEDVNTLTSAGIRALQKIYLLFNPAEHTVQTGRMKLCCAQPQIYHVLSLTGFLQSTPMYENQQAAIQSLDS